MSQVMHESTEDGALLLQRGRSSWLRWKRRSPKPVGSEDGVVNYRTLIPPTRLFRSREELLTIMRDRSGMLRIRELIDEGVSQWDEEQAAEQMERLIRAIKRIPEDALLRSLFERSGLILPPRESLE